MFNYYMIVVLNILSIADSDYTPSMTQLTFQSGQLEKCTDVSILEDTILEVAEEFSVTLDTTDQAVDLSLESATVTIINDDSKCSYVRVSKKKIVIYVVMVSQE